MIITITGVPCGGKTSIVKYLEQKYGFKVISVSKMFRDEATRRGLDPIELNKLLNKDLNNNLDKQIDDLTIKLGTELDGQKVIFDSRLAWHFVPNSFKVYITVSPEILIERLNNSERDEKEKNAGKSNSPLERYELECFRFEKLYDVKHNDFNNYDYVLDNSNMTIEEGAEKIYEAYLNFCKKV